jgi:uncharacterized protein
MEVGAMKDWKAALVFGIAAVAAVGLACFTFFNRTQADDSISVTGMGRMDFSSDRISWSADFSEWDMDLQKAYAKLDQAKLKVLQFLQGAKVRRDELSFEPVEIDELSTELRNANGDLIGTKFAGYSLSARFKLDSPDVDKVEAISRDISSLIRQGVRINSGRPDYFYTALADLEIELVALATQDARIRASRIAASSGAELGKLRYANLGVFQIIALNSSPEASWEGTFDTSSKLKTATITVRAQYQAR